MRQLVFAGSVGPHGPRMRTSPSRPVAVLTILLAHGGVLVLLSRVQPSRTVTPEENSPLTLWFLPQTEENQHAAEEDAAGTHARRARRRATRPASSPRARSMQSSFAQGAAADSAAAAPEQHTAHQTEQQAASAAINWQDEATQAAAATLRTGERAHRQAHALDHPPAMDEGHDTGIVPFRWDSWRARRLEVLPGALLWHISERCAVAFIPFPLPACALGKIPVHGDLFEHLQQQLAQPPPTQP